MTRGHFRQTRISTTLTDMIRTGQPDLPLRIPRHPDALGGRQWIRRGRVTTSQNERAITLGATIAICQTSTIPVVLSILRVPQTSSDEAG